MVVTVRDGRIVRMQDYRNRAAALAGAGLSQDAESEPDDEITGTPPRLHVASALARQVTEVIRSGDAASLQQLLDEHPDLATARLGDPEHGQSRTLLHVVTDWPGHVPDAAAKIQALVAAGADVNARFTGPHTETPLHWAASSDDLDVAHALIAGGASIDVPGGSIGTPVENAVGYGCWHVARLLCAHGARVDKLWVAAGLGLLPLVERLVEQTPPPDRSDIDHAFWQACHGGQLRVAAYLLDRGADIDTTPDHNHARPVEIAGAPDTRRGLLIEWLTKRATT
jgi:ankyrin repeat protein